MELLCTQSISTLPRVSSSFTRNHRFLLRRMNLRSLNRRSVSVTKSTYDDKKPSSSSGYGGSSYGSSSYGGSSYGSGRYGSSSSSFASEEQRESGGAVVEVIEVDENKVKDETIPSVITEESTKENESTVADDFFSTLNIKFDSEDSIYSILLYGGGALAALWLVSAIVSAVDSIPLFPKLMEVVGLGYSFWFTTRYLLFKENRDELGAKVEELKQRVLGSGDD